MFVFWGHAPTFLGGGTRGGAVAGAPQPPATTGSAAVASLPVGAARSSTSPHTHSPRFPKLDRAPPRLLIDSSRPLDPQPPLLHLREQRGAHRTCAAPPSPNPARPSSPPSKRLDGGAGGGGLVKGPPVPLRSGSRALVAPCDEQTARYGSASTSSSLSPPNLHTCHCCSRSPPPRIPVPHAAADWPDRR